MLQIDNAEVVAIFEQERDNPKWSTESEWIRAGWERLRATLLKYME
jgi:hypothetical protein